MAKFITVEATIVDLPAAKKGKYAGKKRHDVLVLRPEGSMEISKKLVPEYAQSMLEAGKKVVMYKNNKAYNAIVEALFPAEQEQSIEDAMAEAEARNAQMAVASNPEPSMEDIMREAEQRNARIDAIRKSNLPKHVKDELIGIV